MIGSAPFILPLHDLRPLEITALVCSVGACAITYHLRRRDVRRTIPTNWLCLTSLFFGVTIWSGHFIAMCRFLGTDAVAINLSAEIISFLITICGFFLAFRIIDRKIGGRISSYLVGLVIGLDIVTVHCLGKTFIIPPNATTYALNTPLLDTLITGLSFIITWMGISAYMIDYYGRKDALQHFKHLASTDSLTGLPNRASFEDFLAEAITQCRKNRHKAAVLIIDLNRFKEINDEHGHHAGDEVLRVIGDRLKQLVNETQAFIARLGGDEFVAILTKADIPDVRSFAKSLQRQASHPIMLNTHPLKISCSIGISMFPDDGDSQETLMRQADLAMYSCKRSNSNDLFFSSAPPPDHDKALA